MINKKKNKCETYRLYRFSFRFKIFSREKILKLLIFRIESDINTERSLFNSNNVVIKNSESRNINVLYPGTQDARNARRASMASMILGMFDGRA